MKALVTVLPHHEENDLFRCSEVIIFTNSSKCICYGVRFKGNLGFNLATLIKMGLATDGL